MGSRPGRTHLGGGKLGKDAVQRVRGPARLHPRLHVALRRAVGEGGGARRWQGHARTHQLVPVPEERADGCVEVGGRGALACHVDDVVAHVHVGDGAAAVDDGDAGDAVDGHEVEDVDEGVALAGGDDAAEGADAQGPDAVVEEAALLAEAEDEVLEDVHVGADGDDAVLVRVKDG